jgi:polyisoprenoid-binding protein YceI
MVSTSVSGPDKRGHYTFNGKLTIKSTTKDISFPFIATPMLDDYIFKGEFTINRKDFDIGGSSTIGNSLNVSLTVLAKKQ